MKNNNTSKLIIAIIAVVLIIAIVGGSTFAYFQWTTAENQKTAVNVTIEQGRITMHIEPTTSTFTGLKPVSNCNNSVGSGLALVTVVNNTGTLAIPSFKLRAKVTKGGTGELTSDVLSHVHYAVVLIDTNVDASGKPSNGSNGSCIQPAEASSAPIEAGSIFTNSEHIATGTFVNVSTSGEWTDLPNESGTYLPRQYNKNTDETSGVTFKAEPYATTYQYFMAYVWIDAEYTATNIGNTVSDPLQNATIELTWSTNSIIEQVSQ